MKVIHNICQFYISIAIVFLMPITACVSIHPLTRSSFEENLKSKPEFWQYSGTRQNIRIIMKFCLSHDENLLFFDADLYAEGIIPVVFSIRTGEHDSLDIDPAHLSIKNDHWSLRTVPYKEIEKILVEKYAGGTYTENDLESLAEKFNEISLVPLNLKNGEEVAGVVFFRGRRFNNFFDASTVVIMGNSHLNGRLTKLVFPLRQSTIND